MMLTLFILFLVFSLLNLFLFQASIFSCLVTIVLSVVGIVLQLGRNKLKLSPKLVTVLMAVCLVLGAFSLVGAGGRRQKGGIQEYEDRLVEIQELLMDGKLDEAVTELSELEAMYDTDDNTRILRALENLLKGNFSEAYNVMGRVGNKTTMLYYTVMERICIEDPSESSVEAVYKLYLEAAEQWPYWTYMQKYAGIAQFEQNNYAGAEYYLLRALEQDASDYRVAYYLGAVNYYQGEEEQSRLYFNEAVKLGADDETCSNIIWYVEQMEER